MRAHYPQKIPCRFDILDTDVVVKGNDIVVENTDEEIPLVYSNFCRTNQSIAQDQTQLRKLVNNDKELPFSLVYIQFITYQQLAARGEEAVRVISATWFTDALNINFT